MSPLASATITLAAVALWGVLHSLLAGPRTKRWVHRRFNSSADRGYRLFYNVVAVLTLLPVMTTSTLALYLGYTLYIVIGSRFEERQLTAEFGQPYLDYRQRVPALIPQPWRGY